MGGGNELQSACFIFSPDEGNRTGCRNGTLKELKISTKTLNLKRRGFSPQNKL
jgi:hypothetical protein